MNTVAFIVNGEPDSAAGRRARAFAEHLSSLFDIKLAYRSGNKLLSLFRLAAWLTRMKPKLCYVFDMSYSGVLAAIFYKGVFGGHLIVDTGDAIYELARSTGNRGTMGLWLTRWLETVALRASDLVVVRGSFHKQMLAEKGVKAELIPDGVETDMFAPYGEDAGRGIARDGVLTVGVLGSSVWSERLQMCYGWDLVEALHLLKDLPVQGMIVGDGSGICRLKSRCKELGIEDRVQFVGSIHYEELPSYLKLMDVCLSTQTNDVAGKVRTTGKLPLYMAAGRYVLASRVGEAALVLDNEMLVDYVGVKDAHYPHKLAERIAGLLKEPGRLRHGALNIAVARERFDYSALAVRMARLFETVLRDRTDALRD